MQDKPKDDVLLVMEERLSLTKRRVTTSRVRVSTRTEAVDSVLPVDLVSGEVTVTRVAVDRRIDAVPQIVTEGDLTIIPVFEERIVVTRELYLIEEVHIQRSERRETSDVPVTVRRQVAHIERIPETPELRSSQFQTEDPSNEL